jgi:tRNA A-37 threonylcarbamoyl transferase component Bud32
MVGEVIAGRYDLERLVEHGGMSTVYLGYDRMLERNVALKVLHPQYKDDSEYVERFRREARAVAQLSHPHIVTVIDRGVSEGHQFIVFEFVEGENLKQLLARTGPMPVQRVIELGIQIADALAFAHARDIVHRDVKPQNVLIDQAGDAKVTDFGIARTLDVERGVTQTGTVLGTSNYLSPEQAEGSPVTPASDVYSLGVVLYEMLTGEVPFRGDNLVVVAMKHVTENPPALLDQRRDVPPRLAAAVERALEKSPQRRFPSMDAFATELRRCLDELGDADTERTIVSGRPAVQPPRRQARAGRGKLPLLLMLAGALLLAGVLAAILIGRSPGKHHGTGGSAGSVALRLQGVGDYDPQGTGGEHGYSAKNATDGNPSTYWDTEIYATQAFGNLKQGLGLVLQASTAAKLKTLTVDTTTPGFTAQVRAGDSPNGPFAPDSSVQTVQDGTTFTLNGTKARYYALWITELPPGRYVRVTEVKAG